MDHILFFFIYLIN